MRDSRAQRAWRTVTGGTLSRGTSWELRRWILPRIHSYAYETFFPWDSDPVGLWKLGVGQEWGPADPKVLSTVIRHGNFDYCHAGSEMG